MHRNLILSLFACLSLPATANAVPITYTVTDTASGTIGTQTFSNQAISVAFAGNTANVVSSGGFVTNNSGVGTITIAGLGTFTFTDSTFFFDNLTQGAAGIGDNSPTAGSILDTFNSAFTTYNGTSTIGPLSGNVFYSSTYTFNTTGGALNLSNAGATSTFTASTPSATVTPEPSSLLLLATGIGGVTETIRRRRADR